jgi:hypothetical protein
MAHMRAFSPSIVASPCSAISSARATRRYIVPDVRERIRVERDNFGRARESRRQRRFDILQTDRADFALRLRDDVGWLQSLQHVGIDFIH